MGGEPLRMLRCARGMQAAAPAALLHGREALAELGLPGGAGTGRKGDAILCVNHTFSVCDLWDQPMIHLSSGVNQGSNKNINI